MYQTQDGIVSISPKSGGIKGRTTFRSSLKLGETHKSRQDVKDIIDDLDDDFSAESYDPFSQNSNHFTDRVAGRLCHTTIPQWVNLSADLAAFSFFYPKLQIASIVEESN